MSNSNSSNTFNQKLTKLEHIYNSIKNINDNDLDNLIALYKEGIQLAKELEKEIQEFEFTIKTVHSTTTHAESETPDEEDNATSHNSTPPPPDPESNSSPSQSPHTHATQYVADLFSEDTDNEYE